MRRTRLSIFFGTALAVLAFAPSAHAVFIMTPQVEFATSPITVGQSGTGTLAFTNDSTAGETTLGGIERIVLEPSCRVPGEVPPCTEREPGIFSISNARGAIGTICAGITFTVTSGIAPYPGALEFRENPATPIPEMIPGHTCVINFTYTALATPAVDTQPGEPGVDTDQSFVVRGDSGGGPVQFGPATDFTAVNPAPPPPLVIAPAPLPAIPLPATPTAKRCKKGQKLKKGKCVRKKRKKK